MTKLHLKTKRKWQSTTLECFRFGSPRSSVACISVRFWVFFGWRRKPRKNVLWACLVPIYRFRLFIFFFLFINFRSQLVHVGRLQWLRCVRHWHCRLIGTFWRRHSHPNKKKKICALEGASTLFFFAFLSCDSNTVVRRAILIFVNALPCRACRANTSASPTHAPITRNASLSLSNSHIFYFSLLERCAHSSPESTIAGRVDFQSVCSLNFKWKLITRDDLIFFSSLELIFFSLSLRFFPFQFMNIIYSIFFSRSCSVYCNSVTTLLGRA